MKLKDFITAEQYFKSKMPKEPRKKPTKDTLELENLDLAEVYLKLKARETKIKDAIAQVEKMAKKEDKKDEKKEKANFAQVAMFMLLTSPITGPMMLVYWKWAFDTIKG